jgi:multimeric flavodoxin WrbA
MKVLLINGSPHEKGCTATALDEVAKILYEEGIETETVWLGTRPISGCLACGKCKTLKCCVLPDIVNEVAKKLDECQGIIVGSPTYYSGPSGQLCAFLDRLFHSASAKLRGKAGACVVSCRRGGASASFERLNQYFLMTNMFVIGSQYWNQVHGNTPEEVRKDLEGLQTMRTLAHNMAYFLKCQEAGEKAGIQRDNSEAKVHTNFIREDD